MPRRRPLPRRRGPVNRALALLLERDLLPGFPQPEWGIFSDTMAKPAHLYQTLAWLAPLLSFPIVTTFFGDLRANTWRALNGLTVPE